MNQNSDTGSTEPERLLELARECARKVIDNEIEKIKQGKAPTVHAFWDVVGMEVRELARLDDTARDQLENAICAELESVEIAYRFKGETPRQGAAHRAAQEMVWARQRLSEAERVYNRAHQKWAELREERE